MNEQALKDRIHSIAKEKGIPFNECWKQLLLSRFLARLSQSNLSTKLIFKGGFLLSYILEIRRETTDLDFLITNISANQEEIINIIKQIASVNTNDGFVFSYESIEPLDQPHMNYPGFRISLNVAFNRIKDKVFIDVGIGDVVLPEERLLPMIEYRGKPLFEAEITLLVYPPETIFAEKLETVISKGFSNSRMKDYHDLILMCRIPNLFQKKSFQNAIFTTFQNRDTSFEFIKFNSAEFNQLQKNWNSHLKDLGSKSVGLNLPLNIKEVVDEINLFLEKQMSSST